MPAIIVVIIVNIIILIITRILSNPWAVWSQFSGFSRFSRFDWFASGLYYAPDALDNKVYGCIEGSVFPVQLGYIPGSVVGSQRPSVLHLTAQPGFIKLVNLHPIQIEDDNWYFVTNLHTFIIIWMLN